VLFVFLGWVPTVTPFSHSSQLARTRSQLLATKPEDEANNLVIRSRRNFIKRSVFVSSGIIGSLLSIPTDGLAYPQEAADKENIKKGYKRLEYLLANWEKETTVCKNNDNPYIGCDRSPEKVMDYLGYKSMEDPLFRADKTLRRLQALVPESNEQDSSDFSDALDVFVEKAEEGNGYAYISSWGEANPGGGKDRVALFIERSKADVTEAKNALATVIRILNL